MSFQRRLVADGQLTMPYCQTDRMRSLDCLISTVTKLHSHADYSSQQCVQFEHKLQLELSRLNMKTL